MSPATADNDTVNPSFDAPLACVSRPSVHTHSAYPTGIMFHLFADGSGPNLIVGNGKKAVQAWEENNPAIILMDVSMPVMNGG